MSAAPAAVHLCDQCDEPAVVVCGCTVVFCEQHKKMLAFECDNFKRPGKAPPDDCDGLLCKDCGFKCTDDIIEHRFCEGCTNGQIGVYTCVMCGDLGCMDGTEQCEKCHQTLCRACFGKTTGVCLHCRQE